MKVEICLGLTFLLCFCFCWFAVLKALLKCVLLWLNFFILPSFNIPGQGRPHSGQLCYTSGKNCRLENLAKYFVIAVNCGPRLNMKRGLSGFPPLSYTYPPPPPRVYSFIFCLWSFKKLDCSSVIKITHASGLQIAHRQEERHFRGSIGQGWKPCNEWRM